MIKRGVLLLLLVVLLVLVGWEEGNTVPQNINVEDTSDIATEWGNRSSTAPGVSFLFDEDSVLTMMDIVLHDDPRIGYAVTVQSYSGNTIIGEYHNDSDVSNPVYDLTITLSYASPNLSISISGEGPLNGATYSVRPTSSYE
jgi:hypothetical protein